jgi:hypothetical protein
MISFLLYTVTYDFPVFSLTKAQKVNDARNQFNSVMSALITFRAECHMRLVEACGHDMRWDKDLVHTVGFYQIKWKTALPYCVALFWEPQLD